jgi:hypothetical protein
VCDKNVQHISLFLQQVSFTNPTATDQPTGRVDFNCEKDCPDQCKEYNKWQYWDNVNDQWANQETGGSKYEIVCPAGTSTSLISP